MKATLNYNLDDPDDKAAHLRAVKSTDMALVIWEIVHNLSRNYENKENAEYSIDDIMDDIMNICNANNIDIDELLL